jgi:hypothetical protein
MERLLGIRLSNAITYKYYYKNNKNNYKINNKITID